MNRMPVGEGFRYLVIGFATTAINIVSYKALLIMGSAYGIATTAAFVLSVLFAYWANARYVFLKSLSKAALIKFFGTRLVTFFLETAGLVGLIELLSFDAFFAKLIVNVVVITLNYLISKFWIFKGDVNESMDR
ncbi:GtrA family protein [Fusibacter paucivorans]|uniref:GtrA family protein n=1 Tax=Fusibacter paucivorans TaxID=76009 RepID=A0ABS5PLN7_9FIRM|nr:GtrA family protein [Fusibacter paucivorans]MBS7525837.1 GtrA family protein [Fusibacter paucivorans]